MIDLDELERLEREATPGPWKIAITKFASGDGWYVVDAHGDFIAGANAPKPSTDEPNTRCVAAARNALPDLIAELRALRARVAEMERDLDACRVELLEARHAVGEAWFAGGVTLAEAIRRKCRMLEEDAAKAAAEVERLRAENERLRERLG